METFRLGFLLGVRACLEAHSAELVRLRQSWERSEVERERTRQWHESLKRSETVQLDDREKLLRLAERTALGLPPLTVAERVAFVEGHFHGGSTNGN